MVKKLSDKHFQPFVIIRQDEIDVEIKNTKREARKKTS